MTVDAIHWPNLISQIKAGNVIPIVGPELLMLPEKPRGSSETPGALSGADLVTPKSETANDDGSNNKRVSVEQRFATRLAAALDLKNVPADARVRDVANQFLEETRYEQRWRLQDAMGQALDLQGEMPPALEHLAAIDGFRLLVSVTPDLLLEGALKSVRRNAPSSVVNAPNMQKQDLPGDLRQLEGTYIFYPFGRVADFEFAITEEDTLEFLFELLSQSVRWQNLFAALRRSHLLFLGCNFPDWLTRFWIRALTGKSIQPSRGTLSLIADRYAREDKNLVLFLKRGAIQIYDQGDANDFVKRLHDEWVSGPNIKSAPTSFEERRAAPQVFISYSWEGDSVAAQRVHDTLKAAGLVVWLDRDRMESGQRITEAMRTNIEQSILFVPLLSQTAAVRRQGYYREEWATAIEHARRISPRTPFIHPVVLDDLTEKSPNAAGIPVEFWRLFREPAPDGNLPPEFPTRLKQLVRDAQ